MSNIGRFKIKTVKNIQTKDVQAYGRILASALQGVIVVIVATETGDVHALALACRFLFFIPPILLRTPVRAAPQRIDAFLARDLRLSARGLLSIPDNYIPRMDSGVS